MIGVLWLITHMTPRSIRRAAERRARKLALKAAKQSTNTLRDDHCNVDDPSSDSVCSASQGPSAAQLLANRVNAQHSTGPKTEAGKAVSSVNNFRHGLAGKFLVLEWEDSGEFNELLENLHAEHQPASSTETLLVESMAQHYWLRQRALRLQHSIMDEKRPACEYPKELALYLRYQATHERAFYKCLNQLLNLRAEKRKSVSQEAALSKRAEDTRIGFESQERKRKAEARKQELHKWNVLLAEAKVDHRALLNSDLAGPERRPAVTPERILAAQKAA
jgi:hypothetical protein